MPATAECVEKPVPKCLTWEEFLDWPEEIYAEWVDGEVLLLTVPSDEHQQIVFFISTLMLHYTLHTGAGEVRSSGSLVKLPKRGRVPDALFVAKENLGRLTPQYLAGAPDIAVEVVSKGTRQTDERLKLREYEAAGAREYWLMDPEKQAATFYRLGTDGTYTTVAINGTEFVSEALPGFRLDTALLWDAPLLRLPDALRALGLA